MLTHDLCHPGSSTQHPRLLNILNPNGTPVAIDPRASVFAWEPVRIGIYQSEELVQRRSVGMASSDFGNPLGYPRQASLATMHLLARRPQAQGQGLLPRTEAPFWGSEPICSQSLLVHCAHRRRRATQHELVLESRCQHPENRGACGVKRQLNPV